ncbi:MAG TPA: heavy-metal-associated domain-containing protein [Novosphingobium sp.]|nr:heavy-metal-associated domain-containing protein [Novosphingobium sp.]
MVTATAPSRARFWRPGPAAMVPGMAMLALGAALLVAGPERLIAQIEGDRGIVPIASSSDIEISGVEVNATGKDGEEARLNGWQEAARKAWAKAGGPAMSDGQLQGMVTAVVIEHEQVGPRRYIAKLSVVFDRARAGQFIGTNGGATVAHSAPMMIIPVLYSGGTAQVYEVRGAWQKAWAEFRAGASPIDYVRPSGAAGESLLITAGQPSRRSRAWWRNVLDQFGAADVLMPVARLERQWPGGPVRGTFTARYGPDNTYLASFTLSANDEAGLEKMLADAAVRLDSIYAQALAEGKLKPDTTLNVRPQIDPALAALIAAGQAAQAPVAAPSTAASAAPTPEPTQEVKVSTFTVQFASPDAAAVDAALGAVRSAPGVQGASTTSLAVGGTSLMRVSYAGDLATLAEALRARGWRVTVGANALSIRR